MAAAASWIPGSSSPSIGHGVALADFDADGDLDAFIVCHQSSLPSRVYLNDGTGMFTDSGQEFGDARWSGVEVHLLDLNGDGHIDVHVSYYSDSRRSRPCLPERWAGRLQRQRAAAGEDTLAWGDLDGDGDVDYFGKHWGEGYVVRLNDGRAASPPGWQMADPQVTLGGIGLADFDGDGDLDALVANGFRETGSQPGRLFWNDGRGQFTDSGQLFNHTMGADLAVGDLDLDGDLDVVIANMDRPNEVWLYEEGSFIDSGLRLGQDSDMSSMPMLGDLDGDGDLDVVIGRFNGGAEIWFNLTINQSKPMTPDPTSNSKMKTISFACATSCATYFCSTPAWSTAGTWPAWTTGAGISSRTAASANRWKKPTAIWETEDGQIAGVLNALSRDEIRLHVHPKYRTPALEEEMLAYAEAHFFDLTQSGRPYHYLPVFTDDTRRQEIVLRRGYQKADGFGHHWRRDLDAPIPETPVRSRLYDPLDGGARRAPGSQLGFLARLPLR